MNPNAKTDVDWGRSTAILVVDEFIYPNFITKQKFQEAASIAAQEIHSWLVRRDYPRSYGMIEGEDNVDHTWTTKVAASTVDGLVNAGLMVSKDRGRAIEMAEEELWARLIVEDRPPQK